MTNGDWPLLTVELRARRQRRQVVVVGGLLAHAARSHEAYEVVERGDPRALLRLCAAESEEDLEVRRRHPVRTRSGVIVHATKDAIIFREGFGSEGREAGGRDFTGSLGGQKLQCRRPDRLRLIKEGRGASVGAEPPGPARGHAR